MQPRREQGCSNQPIKGPEEDGSRGEGGRGGSVEIRRRPKFFLFCFAALLGLLGLRRGFGLRPSTIILTGKDSTTDGTTRSTPSDDKGNCW
ncbi:unnamed protein product [Heligmosomoides polygyrus]|uniref:Uncharacterized protein n=1 Tax=Heligmosomoides polygyrus TaxID=6339 RepID=A0A183FLL6_HELPZ|nr:unnamed protein product [Heligmosomoides polygyrus]